MFGWVSWFSLAFTALTKTLNILNRAQRQKVRAFLRYQPQPRSRDSSFELSFTFWYGGMPACTVLIFIIQTAHCSRCYDLKEQNLSSVKYQTNVRYWNTAQANVIDFPTQLNSLLRKSCKSVLLPDMIQTNYSINCNFSFVI